MKQYFKILGLILCAGTLFIQPLAAEEVRVSATVDRKQVALGESVKLGVTITGKQNVSPIQLPPLDGFDIHYIGPSRNISVVNGSYSSSVTFNYSLLPTREGKLTIPPLRIPIDSDNYTTNSIVIEVGNSQGGTQTLQSSLKDKIFLEVRTAKTDVYINEPIALKVFLYATDVQISDVQYPALDNVGFSEDEFEKPKQYQQNIQGRQFNIIEFTKTIYPTRVGDLKLGPANLESNLVTQKSSSRRNNLFDDPFFSSFFGRQEKRPMTLKSNQITLNVMDLPQENQPKDFSGAVGQYSFDVKIGPSTEVQVGDPLTLKMTIGGRGNLQSAPFPEINQTNDFKLYDPNISERPGLKEYEQVLIPTSTDVNELKALSFTYFDPDAQQYKTVTKGPFALTVRPPADDGGIKVVGMQQPAEILQPEEIGQDIIFIKDRPGKVKPVQWQIYHSVWYWIFLIATLGLFITSYIFFKRSHLLETDSGYARTQRAPKAARAGLAQAQECLEAQQKEEFYDTVFKTMQSYLSDKFILPAGSITVSNIHEKIQQDPNKDTILKSLEKLFQECEMVRYASGSISIDQMQNTFDQMQATIALMERMK